MGDVEVLAGVLAKVEQLAEGVDEDARQRPTPCPKYDVAALLDHIVGWMGLFADSANGRVHEGDPAAEHAGDEPAGEIAARAARLLSGWRTGGVDREVPMMGGQQPGAFVLGMQLIEYVGHGYDLAVGSGQAIPFTDAEAEAALTAAKGMLKPEYRGEAFGPEVAVPDDAPAIDRFAGFIGRQPRG